MDVRPFTAGDAEAVNELHLRAFDGRSEEPRLVKRLHAADKAVVSLVAVEDDHVVGHVVFSPVVVDGHRATHTLVGLAPIGVLPEQQNRGIGSILIQQGLVACHEADCDAVVVLGEPEYYSRFGFERASKYGLDNEYDVDAGFLVAPLKSGALDGVRGKVRYQPEFRAVGV